MAVESFERWLRNASRNVHAWGTADLIDAVLAVEAVLSEFHFDGLEEENVGEELDNAIRPFVVRDEVVEMLAPHNGFRLLPNADVFEGSGDPRSPYRSGTLAVPAKGMAQETFFERSQSSAVPIRWDAQVEESA